MEKKTKKQNPHDNPNRHKELVKINSTPFHNKMSLQTRNRWDLLE